MRGFAAVLCKTEDLRLKKKPQTNQQFLLDA